MPNSLHDIEPFQRGMCSSDWHQCPLHRQHAKMREIANSVLLGSLRVHLSLSCWCSTSSQRCRINGLPDLVYYWASLKGGKKRALDFDWWVPLSSQITVHPSPNSQVPRLLFSCAWPPILTQPPLIWILSFDSIVIIDLPVSRATSPSVIVWDIKIHSRTT